MVDTNTLIQLLEFQLKINSLTHPLGGQGVVAAAIDTPSTISALWFLLKSLFDNFIGVFADLSQIIHIFDFLPSAWVSLFIVLLGLVVGLRIYSFFSDVEIGGFKI